MDEGIGKTVKLFLLWLGLFLVLPIIGSIIGRFFTSLLLLAFGLWWFMKKPISDSTTS
ncbi:MAG: hypothetical protein IKG95_02780 [Bacteroidales bacterium]|nr:hypothetical protein [Bacteroidales bacterium]